MYPLAIRFLYTDVPFIASVSPVCCVCSATGCVVGVGVVGVDTGATGVGEAVGVTAVGVDHIFLYQETSVQALTCALYAFWVIPLPCVSVHAFTIAI